MVCVNVGLRRAVDEQCDLLEYYVALTGSSVPTSKTSWPLKRGPIGCPQTLVEDYHWTLRNIPEARTYHSLR
jgi:hypothetical protein